MAPGTLTAVMVTRKLGGHVARPTVRAPCEVASGALRAPGVWSLLVSLRAGGR